MNWASPLKTERQGLTFTAISRVKSLDGLRFQPPFSYDRYEKMGKCAGVSKRRWESVPVCQRGKMKKRD